jgi:hypothetical protein
MYYNPCYSQNSLHQGPSPVIPFLLVICLGLLVCWESMQGYYEMLFEVKESAEEWTETLAHTLIIIILVGVLSCSFMGDRVVVVVPIAVLLSVFLLQNEVLCVLVLLLVLSFFAMYSYPSQTEGYHQYGWNSNWSRPVYQSRPDFQLNNVETGERRSDMPFSLTPGQICYLIMLGCLTTCTMFSEDQNIWWTCMALLLVCVLYVNFLGRGNREWIL